jgi:4-hydroxy-tetrahydrodipicolinate reductase
MIKACIVGACGRMGTQIANLFKESNGFELCGAVEAKGSEYIGTLIHGEVEVLEDISYAGRSCDVVIDFSSESGVIESIKFASKSKKAFVSGVTGLGREAIQKMHDAANTIPVFHSANMSVGIAVVSKAVDLAARILSDFDIEIFDIHHRKKKDAPSGTALMLGEVAAKARGLTPFENFCFARYGNIGERQSGQIGFSVARGGSCAGEHSVYFLGDDEFVEITHRSSSRKIFAAGAIAAARWLFEKKLVGFYSMQDIV